MPAMLDDPTAAVIYRASGDAPYPAPYAPLPAAIVPRQVTLRDRSTIATLIPFSAHTQVPKTLVSYLCALLNREIEKGDTYPMINPLAEESFGPYWFANFGAVMFLGEVGGIDDVWAMESEMEAKGEWDWNKRCLGSFYVKPNYPGRSSHVCNGGFLVSDAARNRGVGRLMGEGYLEWAPKLGYTYSVFNLVYETNIASMRIWDALGFKRIGRVPGCGNLKSHPDTLIDAIIFGRDLNGEAEDYLSEERFDKIRYYLKTGMYPNGSDRAEKSRLRSAGAHYRLVPDADNASGEDKLMLKDKEVISDPQKQYEIAHKTHSMAHAGINKTTASIADKYHWIRIKETVSQAIRNCAECRESSKPGASAKGAKGSDQRQGSPKGSPQQQQQSSSSTSVAGGGVGPSPYPVQQQKHQQQVRGGSASAGSEQDGHHHQLQQQQQQQHHHQSPYLHQHQHSHGHNQAQGHLNTHMDPSTTTHNNTLPLSDMHGYEYDALPVDPQIMDYHSHDFGAAAVSHEHEHDHQHQHQHQQLYGSADPGAGVVGVRDHDQDVDMAEGGLGLGRERNGRLGNGAHDGDEDGDDNDNDDDDDDDDGGVGSFRAEMEAEMSGNASGSASGHGNKSADGSAR